MNRVVAIILALSYMFYTLGIEWAAAIIGWRYMRKSWAPAYKWLVALAWVTCAVEMVTTVCMFCHINYDPLYNVFALVETGALLYIQFLLATRRTAARLLMALLGLLVVGTATCFIVWPTVDSLHLRYIVFNMFVQLVGVCVALIDILQVSTEKLLSRQPAFWLNIGLLFYCSIFIIIHIVGIWSVREAGDNFIWFSLVGNTFMYFGYIACFRTLRKEEM